MIKKSAVDKHLYVNYLKRSRECLNSAGNSFETKEYDASAINSVHAAISAADALCVYYTGWRHSGEKHEDIKKLMLEIKEIGRDELDALAKRVIRVIKMKNMAEYEERSVKQKEAETLLNTAKAVFEDIRKRVE
jgi:HEPN domain-containing protein